MISLNAPAGPAPSPFDPERQKRFDEAFDKAVAKYPAEKRRAALLAVLHIAQELLGWLPERAMAYVGWRLDIPPVRVREVATFYTMYRLQPTGRNHIEICNSISCWAMGSEKLFESCERKLGIRRGEKTKDGQFSLGEVACLAACGGAPAVLVNNYRYAENMTPEKLDALVDELARGPGLTMHEEPKAAEGQSPEALTRGGKS